MRAELPFHRWSYGILFQLCSSLLLSGLLLCLTSCTPNHPYPEDERQESILYTDFHEAPKHLDPAISYSSDEYTLLENIVEPPFEYHYLKRPYELIPATSTSIPKAQHFDDTGKPITAPSAFPKAHRIHYDIELKKGILYQNHPCFVKTKWSDKVLSQVQSISDFPEVATRELLAKDYVLQIKRLADPRLSKPSPILPIMEKYIAGLSEYAKELRKQLEDERAKRKQSQGPLYNQELDERANPIVLDLEAIPLEGAVVLGPHQYRLVLKKAYPQILYWLAMPFFGPMPAEALSFFEQGILNEKGLNIDRCPLGTGPYKIEKFDANLEIVLSKNENYRSVNYPSEGEEGDVAKGLLKDAGQKLPLMDKIIFKRERESLPRWNKFLQGYYDTSGIASDSFEQAIQVSDHGNVEASKLLKEKNIRLMTSPQPSIMYVAFNMMDPTVGGYSPEQQKLRQAIGLAIDMEEFIQIFLNGRGVPAQGPLPPGLFGYRTGREGVNPHLYQWDEQRHSAQRKNIEAAKALLAEAGYPDGKTKSGEALKIKFVNYWNFSSGGARISWFEKQFQKIGLEMVNETTDYNRFREKMDQGNYQFTMWGWNADYPDPENFLFLLYGPNSRKEHSGENVSNYDNPKFNELFQKMESMANGPERLKIIHQMLKLTQEDMPWVGGYYPVGYGLYHEWYQNAKPNAMLRGGYKYKNIDHDLREQKRSLWNRPMWWPIGLLFALGLILTYPAYRTIVKRGQATA